MNTQIVRLTVKTLAYLAAAIVAVYIVGILPVVMQLALIMVLIAVVVRMIGKKRR